MKINSQCKVTNEIETTLTPSFKPAGCLFHVIEKPNTDNPDKLKYNVTCPFSGHAIAQCNQFTTAVKFANLLHDILLQNDLILNYSNAKLTKDERANIWKNQTPLKHFYHLRLCKPGQFDKALAEQLIHYPIKPKPNQ